MFDSLPVRAVGLKSRAPTSEDVGRDVEVGTGLSTPVIPLHSQLEANTAAAKGSPESFSNENGASRPRVGVTDGRDNETTLGVMVGSTDGEGGGGVGTAEKSSRCVGIESGDPATTGVSTTSKGYARGELGGAS